VSAQADTWLKAPLPRIYSLGHTKSTPEFGRTFLRGSFGAFLVLQGANLSQLSRV